MRHRDNNIQKSQLTLKVQGWRKKISAIAKQIRKEYDDYSTSADRSAAVMYREYLISAALFLDRADEMLAEHIDVIERHEALEKAQEKRRLTIHNLMI